MMETIMCNGIKEATNKIMTNINTRLDKAFETNPVKGTKEYTPEEIEKRNFSPSIFSNETKLKYLMDIAVKKYDDVKITGVSYDDFSGAYFSCIRKTPLGIAKFLKNGVYGMYSESISSSYIPKSRTLCLFNDTNRKCSWLFVSKLEMFGGDRELFKDLYKHDKTGIIHKLPFLSKREVVGKNLYEILEKTHTVLNME